MNVYDNMTRITHKKRILSNKIVNNDYLNKWLSKLSIIIIKYITFLFYRFRFIFNEDDFTGHSVTTKL